MKHVLISRIWSQAQGFTLVETLIAVAVIALAIAGPFQIAQGVLKNAYNARDQMIAASLAQEAVEYIREVRDSNYLYNARYGAGSVNWLGGFDGTNGPNCYQNACVVDPHYYQASIPFSAGYSVLSCGGATCTSRPLFLDSASYRYNQQTIGAQTKFIRTVRLTQISSTETLITVTVTWESHGTQTVELSEYLHNWL